MSESGQVRVRIETMDGTLLFAGVSGGIEHTHWSIVRQQGEPARVVVVAVDESARLAASGAQENPQ